MPQRYYPFGRKPAAILGLLLTSPLSIAGAAGLGAKLRAFAYRRPPDNSSETNPELPPPAMISLFDGTLPLTDSGSVTFEIGIPKDRSGLLSLELLGWPKPYDINRVHFLGKFNPFGTDEVPYTVLGGLNRADDPSKQSNRVFKGEFTYNLRAGRPADIARFKLTDVESGGESTDDLSVSTYSEAAIPGGLLVVVRVDGDNFKNGCAWFRFTDKGTRVGIDGKNFSKVVLNEPTAEGRYNTHGWEP